MRRTPTLLLAACLLATACSSSKPTSVAATIAEGKPATTVITPASRTTVTTGATPTATTVPTTLGPVTSAATTVATAPAEQTIVTLTLPPGSPTYTTNPWVPVPGIPLATGVPYDPADPNNRTATEPAYAEVMNAYRAYFAAYSAVISTAPVDPTSARFAALSMTGDFRTALAQQFTGLANRHLVLDVSGGLTSRPHIITTDNADKVWVGDCLIDASYLKDSETGAKAPAEPGFPNAGPPGVINAFPTLFRRIDGVWLIDWDLNEGVPTACAPAG